MNRLMLNRFRISFLQGALVPPDTHVAVIGLFLGVSIGVLAASSLDFPGAVLGAISCGGVGYLIGWMIDQWQQRARRR